MISLDSSRYFDYSVVTVDGNDVLRVTQVDYEPGECGDLLHPYPEYDFTGPEGVKDCIVNFYDFALFSENWLECTFDCQ